MAELAVLAVTSSAQASRGLCPPWDGVTRQREARGRRAQTCTGVSPWPGHFRRTIRCEKQTRARLTCQCKWQSTSWFPQVSFENTVPNLAQNLHVADVGRAGWSCPRLRPPIFDHYLGNQISYIGCSSPHPSIIPLRPLFEATCLKAQRLMEPIELCQTLPEVAPCALRLCMMSINGNNNDDRTY